MEFLITKCDKEFSIMEKKYGKKLIYKSLAAHSDEEIKRILREGTYEETVRLPLEAGMNHHDWNLAFRHKI